MNGHIIGFRPHSGSEGVKTSCGLTHLLCYSQDGGLLTNNPCSIAIHEARLLWPDEPFQCIVSIGTGKYKGRSGPSAVEFSSLREKLLKIVASATDTEGKF